MRRVPTRLAHALAACLLVLLPLAARAASPWPTDPGQLGMSISNTASSSPISCSDGSGGVFVAWYSSYFQKLYVQHVSALGVLLWGTSGVQVGGDSTSRPDDLVADFSGGCYLSWTTGSGITRDIWVQHFSNTGSASWAAGGVAACSNAGAQYTSANTVDAWGNFYVVWQDDRAALGASDVYCQVYAYNSTGTPALAANGVAVCNATGAQSNLGIVPGGTADTYVCWQDERAANKAIYAQRLGSTGTPLWAANGVAVTTALGADAWAPVAVGDGRGGVIIAWYDWRNGNADVFAQRYGTGSTPLWIGNGVALTTNGFDQTGLAIASDAAGGAVVAWTDVRNGTNDIYAQHVSTAGTVTWTSGGVPLCTAAGSQSAPVATGDGTGGAIVGWTDRRSLSDDDFYVQHVTAAGGAQWTADGVGVCTMSGDQYSLSIDPDAAYGAILVYHYGATIEGAWVDRFGMLGGAAPTITAVADVPNDQGGYVSIRWNKSRLDVMPSDPITAYWIWRQLPQAPALAALRGGAALLAAGEAPRPGALRAQPNGVDTYYWEYLGSVSAQGQAGYSVVEPTRGDSVAGSNPQTLFMVEARWAALTGEYWDSDAVGGYSVDDLAPIAPAPFAGTYTRGSALLSWGPNAEADLAGYRLYRGTTAGFVPGAGNRIASVTGTSYLDAAGRPYYYKLAAVDVHGNEGPATLLQPSGTTGVTPSGHVLALAAPAPNPSRGAADLAFTLPAAGGARLALYDLAGRCVRELARGEFGPGEQRVRLDARAGSALAPGVYLLRLDAAGRTLTRRLAIVD